MAQARATRSWPQPRAVVGPLKPKPGSDGTTRWNRSVSSGIRPRNSTTEPGHPWVRISGSASGVAASTCRKCIFCPSITVVKCGYALSASSAARQSNAAHRSASERMRASGMP